MIDRLFGITNFRIPQREVVVNAPQIWEMNDISPQAILLDTDRVQRITALRRVINAPGETINNKIRAGRQLEEEGLGRMFIRNTGFCFEFFRNPHPLAAAVEVIDLR